MEDGGEIHCIKKGEIMDFKSVQKECSNRIEMKVTAFY